MRMEEYQNLSGTSGVAAFFITRNAIAVKFVNGDTYLYTGQSAGRDNIRTMKMLARAGKGLSSFISTHVHNKYAAIL